MRLDRFVTLNLVQPFHRVCRALNPRSSTLDRRLPILMYHSISDDPESGVSPYYRTCTHPARFREQLALLHSAGYHGVTLTTGLAWLNAKQAAVSVPPLSGERAGEGSVEKGQLSTLDPRPSSLDLKPVVLTFDDGFRDFYTEAFPLLREFGCSATMYLPTGFIGDDRRPFSPRASSQTTTSRDCLTWNEVREMHVADIEFGDHTVNHPKLVELSWSAIESEVANSKSQIEQQLGAPVPAFAYPYAFPQADKNFTATFRQLLQRVGYASCVTTEVGRARFGDDQFQLARLPVNSNDDAALLEAKLNGAYDWLAFPQALMKQIKQTIRPARKPTKARVRSSTAFGPGGLF